MTEKEEYLFQWFLNICAYKSPGVLVKTQTVDPSWLGGPSWGPKLYTSNKFPDDAKATGLETTLQALLISRDCPVHCRMIAASLACTHWLPAATLLNVTTENVSASVNPSSSQMFCRGENCPLRITDLDRWQKNIILSLNSTFSNCLKVKSFTLVLFLFFWQSIW